VGGAAFSLAFDASGSRIATGRGTSSARIWDIVPAAGPNAPAVFAADDARLLAMSPGGFQLVRGDDRGGVHFLDRGQPWSPLQADEAAAGHAGPITALAYSPDGSHLVSVGADGSVLLWDAAGRKLAGQRFHHGSGPVRSAAIGPDNRTIVTGGQLGARLWDGVSGEPGPVLGPGRRITGVAFSGDGSEVWTLTADAIELWRSESGEQVWSAALPAPPVSTALRDEPSQLAVALEDGRLLLWDRPPVDSPIQFELRGSVLAMSYTPAGSGLLIQTGEWMHLLSVDGERRVLANSLLPAIVPAGAWQAQSADGDSIALATRDGAHDLGLQILELSSPAVPPAPDSLADQENLWLSRLKLRFDTTGKVIADVRNANRPAPAGAGTAVPPRLPLEGSKPPQR
jgi:WD40 repeat protein